MPSRSLLSRSDLSRFLPTHEAIVAWEKMHESIDAAVAAQQTADQAVQDAAVAQSAADAAQVTADAAQADVDLVEAVPFVLAAPSAVVPQARVLAVDPLALTATDAGPGGAMTLASADRIAILPGDVTESAGTLADATGLLLALVANATYIVDGIVTFQSAALTTGIALAFTLPAGAAISGRYAHNISATGIEGSYNIASGAVKGNTTAVLVANENVPITGRWLITTAATPGNAQLQFRTEVPASGVTLKAGVSALVARRIA